VNLTLGGAITTSGDGANAVIGQVIGGGGGLFDQFAGSTGGANSSTDGNENGKLEITVEADASISTTGTNSTAIFAQNVTGNGNAGNDITITVNGSVSTQSGDTNFLDGGDENTVAINNGGSVTSAYTETAVSFEGTKKLTITNSGTLTGGISNQGAGLRVGDELLLITASTGSTANDFGDYFINNATFDNVATGVDLSLHTDTGGLVLKVDAVPEPTTTLLLAVAILGWLLRRPTLMQRRSNRPF